MSKPTDDRPGRQSVLPGTGDVIATYGCGHGRTHQIPSQNTAVYRKGGAGFVGVCGCGPEDPSEAADVPHHLNDHVSLLGGTNLDDALWLRLDEEAAGWWSPNPTEEPPSGGPSERDRRDQYRREVRQRL